MLAAIGVGQLERFADMQRRRREIAAIYDARLADLPEVGRPVLRPGITHARHLYALALDLDRLSIDRAVFIRELRAENIGPCVGRQRRWSSLFWIRRLRRSSFCCVVLRTRNASLRIRLKEHSNPLYTREIRRFECFFFPIPLKSAETSLD